MFKIQKRCIKTDLDFSSSTEFLIKYLEDRLVLSKYCIFPDNVPLKAIWRATYCPTFHCKRKLLRPSTYIHLQQQIRWQILLLCLTYSCKFFYLTLQNHAVSILIYGPHTYLWDGAWLGLREIWK